jgi:hypothetical protein
MKFFILILVSFSAFAAKADWVHWVAKGSATADNPTLLASMIGNTSGMRDFLTGVQLVSKSKLVITKISYATKYYQWDNNCEMYAKFALVRLETSYAEGYFLSDPEDIWAFDHSEQSNVTGTCPGFRARLTEPEVRDKMRRIHR